MLAFISYKPVASLNQVDRAKLADDVSAVRLQNQIINHANQIWESFALKSGGSIIESAGTTGTLQIEAEYLTDLQDVVNQYSIAIKDDLQVGVGLKLSEATSALNFLVQKGRKGIFLFDPEYIELETMEKAVLGQNKGAHAGFDGHHTGSPHKAKADDNSEITAISKEILDAKTIESKDKKKAPEATFHLKAQKQSKTDKANAQKKTINTDKLKQQLVQVLQQIKGQTNDLAVIKQQAPDIYNSLMSLVQSVITLGRSVFGEVSPVIKSESVDDYNESVDDSFNTVDDLTKAISEIKPGVKLDKNPYIPVGSINAAQYHGNPDWKRFHQSFDYSHHLPDAAKSEGLKLVVHHHGYEHKAGNIGRERVESVLYSKNGISLGKVEGMIKAPGRGFKEEPRRAKEQVMEPHSKLAPEYQGRGLGTAMYEAAYSHAKNHLGIKKIEGSNHSADADALHKRLSKKHGFRYVSKMYPDSIPGDPTDEYPYMPYSYTIKNDEFNTKDHLIFGKGHGIIFLRENLNKNEDLDKSIADIKGGPQVPIAKKVEWGNPDDPNSKTYDYTHIIPESVRNDGYRIHVNHGGHGNLNYFTARLYDKKNQNVGYVHAFSTKPGVIEPHSFIEKPHTGKGLGVSMYEALYSKAKEAGIHTVKGGEHSAKAARVHESLSRKHGFNYKKKPNPEYGISSATEHGPYSYALKSEFDGLSDDDKNVIEEDITDDLDKAWGNTAGGSANPLGIARVKYKNAPPGTQDKGKVKVKRKDGSSAWFSQKAGSISAQERDAPLLGANSFPVSPGSKEANKG